jgi:MscS family membrane protein
VFPLGRLDELWKDGLDGFPDITFELLLSLGLVIALMFARHLIRKHFLSSSKQGSPEEIRALRLTKALRMLLVLVFLMLLPPVWLPKLKALGLYVVSFATVMVFAFFAVFSILSNVSASVILFLGHPMKIGSQIRLLDGKDSLTGRVTDITLFSVRLQTEEGYRVSFPNNLLLQRGVLVLSEKN